MTTQAEFDVVPPSTKVEPEPKVEKKKRAECKDRARGVVKCDISGEKYTVITRASGVYIRRPKKRGHEFKPMQEVVDFVIGQSRLPLEEPPQAEATVVASFDHQQHTDLIDMCVQYIASHKANLNDPKYFKRLKYWSDALMAELEAQAPGRVDALFHQITK